MEDTSPPVHDSDELPEYLEEIVKGSHPSLGEPGRQLLRDLLLQYRHVFPAPGEPVTGRTSAVQHDIITTDARPVRCGPRRLAPAGLRKEQTCVREMLEGEQIEPSDSPWASPVVLVTKKDGSTRFCVDYRRLNALTTKDAHPLPRIDDSLRLLGNQQWFSTMDIASGYWQVAMSPEAKRKAAFVTIERLMDRVLCGMRWSRCLVYLDDVISLGGSVTEALGCLEEVLCSLSNFGLQLKAKKCTFMQTEVVFLGHIVGRTGLACDPAKLIAVQNWHAPDDGLVERFNRTLLMMLAIFAGEHKDDWDDLLPPVMMAYRSSVHESTGFSPYRLMFGEECMLPMDIGMPHRNPDPVDNVASPYAVWVKDSLEVAFDQVRRHSGKAVRRQK